MPPSVNGCYFRGGVKCNFVYYYGRRYGSDKEVFWQDADVFVFPSHYRNECFPLVLLEAMQHGVACISTREGGIPDIIEDGKTGFLIDRHNPDQLAEKITLFAESPHLVTEFGASARKAFEEQFALGIFEERLKGIFSELVTETNR